jgi:hypothetical protein
MILPNTDILLSKYDRQINKTFIEKDLLLFGSRDGGWMDGRTHRHLNTKKYKTRATLLLHSVEWLHATPLGGTERMSIACVIVIMTC